LRMEGASYQEESAGGDKDQSCEAQTPKEATAQNAPALMWTLDPCNSDPAPSLVRWPVEVYLCR
jgi:hypothetical protein